MSRGRDRLEAADVGRRRAGGHQTTIVLEYLQVVGGLIREREVEIAVVVDVDHDRA